MISYHDINIRKRCDRSYNVVNVRRVVVVLNVNELIEERKEKTTDRQS